MIAVLATSGEYAGGFLQIHSKCWDFQQYFAKTDPGAILSNYIENKYLPTVEKILESVLSEEGFAMKVSDPAGFAIVDPSAEHIVQGASDAREDYEKNGSTLDEGSEGHQCVNLLSLVYSDPKISTLAIDNATALRDK